MPEIRTTGDQNKVERLVLKPLGRRAARGFLLFKVEQQLGDKLLHLPNSAGRYLSTLSITI